MKDRVDGQVVVFTVEQSSSAGGVQAFGLVEVSQSEQSCCMLAGVEYAFGPKQLHKKPDGRSEI